jgi:hypothetical protein
VDGNPQGPEQKEKTAATRPAYGANRGGEGAPV